MPNKRRGSRAQGFSLVEMALVLLIVGVIMIFTLPVSNMIASNQRRAATLQNLKNIQSALNNYVTLNKRLPCPADGTATPGTTPPWGTEAPIGGGTCTGNQANGVVPWVTLGLSPADARDAWFNQITYRVGWGLTRSNALNMSSCDPAGMKAATPGWPDMVTGGLCDQTSCTGTFAAANCTSPTSFLANKGLNVFSDATTQVMNYANYTGAAYILISHGDNGYGAISGAGSYVAAAANGVKGTLEDANRNLATLVVTNGAPPQFIDATMSDAPDNSTGTPPNYYFDDIIIRPSLLSVINQAQLGPRSH